MKKSIFLVDPPFQRFMNFSKRGIPLGLLSLAGEIKKHGDDVLVLDSDYNPHGEPYPFVAKIGHYDEYLQNLDNLEHPIWNEIKEKIDEKDPDVVGISVISTKLKSAINVAKIAKEMGVKKVIAGGPHVTLFPEEILRYENLIDSIVVGEGEEIFDEAISRRITYANRIKNLNNLEWSARESLVGIENYSPEDLGYVMTSRGCPNACNFCCSKELWGRRVRNRDIGDVIAEIDSVKKDFGTKKFYMVDDTFTLSPRRVRDFCDMVKDKDYQWSCLTRVDRVDEGLLKTMADSGCYMVKLGIESGSESVLNAMNKGITVPQIEQASEILNRLKFPWVAYIMVGVPGETTEDVDKTIELINQVRPSFVSAAIYTPYPKTGFYQCLDGKRDFAREEANHHSLRVLAGDVPREKIMELMNFADRYNHDSRKAREIYKC